MRVRDKYFPLQGGMYSFHVKMDKEVYVMAYVINDDCISCGVCEPECPTSCISEADSKYVIAEADCISCGACSGVCPVNAPNEA